MKRIWLALLTLILTACSTVAPEAYAGEVDKPVVAPTPMQKITPTQRQNTEIPEPTESIPMQEPPYQADLPDLGTAPELENQVWLNSDHPLRLADLRGKVVLIDMWTFG